MRERVSVYNNAKSDLSCINWSETDGSDVKNILKSAFTRYRNHKPEIIKKFNDDTGFNKFQKTMIIGILKKM